MYLLKGNRYWILDTGYWILDTGYWILDTGYWILDTGKYEIIFECQDIIDLRYKDCEESSFT